MPYKRSPTASRGSQFSSRWKRIVLAMQGGQLLLHLRRASLRLMLSDKLLVRFDVGVYFGTMAMVVCQGRVHGGKRQPGVRGADFLWAHSHPLMPDGDMLDLNSATGDMRLAAAVARPHDDLLVTRRDRPSFGFSALKFHIGHCI